MKINKCVIRYGILLNLFFNLNVSLFANESFKFFLNERNNSNSILQIKQNDSPYSSCQDQLQLFDQTQIQQIFSKNSNTCHLLTSNRNDFSNLKYRSYLFSSNGLLMVFVSLGSGDDNTTTGAKEFYFFPRNNQSLQYRSLDNQKILFNLKGPFDFTMDSITSQLINSNNAFVKVDTKISAENNAGVIIIPKMGFVLESPFTLGGAPTSKPNAESFFIDRNNLKCRFLNKEIFRYIDQDNVIIQYSDNEVMNKIKNRCPLFLF